MVAGEGVVGVGAGEQEGALDRAKGGAGTLQEVGTGGLELVPAGQNPEGAQQPLATVG
jgi:hypothetical protein